MGILDKLKFKKEEEQKAGATKPVAEKQVDTSKAEESKKAEKEEKVETVKKTKADTAEKKSDKKISFAYRVLTSPQISEKATALSMSGKYVFKVDPHANKSEIKKAIETTFDVHVKAVNIMNVSGKARRYGRSTGKTKDWKKAIVTVAPGEHIAGVTAAEAA